MRNAPFLQRAARRLRSLRGAVTGAMTAALLVSTGYAQQPFPVNPPPPPPRPTKLDSAVGVDHTPTGTIASPAGGETYPRKVAPPQPTLPPYDRDAMRACGLEWQEMKRTGASQGRLWRDFAAECLPRNGAGR